MKECKFCENPDSEIHIFVQPDGMPNVNICDECLKSSNQQRLKTNIIRQSVDEKLVNQKTD